MKEIVNDTTLSAAVRAAAMSILGNEYTVSGGDPAVFAEIYKDAPFSSYLVPGDPQLSAMNLEKESYAIKPSSVAAIKVAVLASGKYFVDTKQSASTTAAYIATAVDYLNKADSAALDEAKAASPVSFTSSDRYILFSFARALTIGRLAIEKGEPFKSEYRNEFENFIAFAQSRKSTLADDEMLHARFQYAIILAADKDTAGEKAQLDLLARGMNGLSNPNASTFVVSVRNAHAYRPTGTSWSNIQKMFAVSPDFKVAVEKVLSGSAVTPT